MNALRVLQIANLIIGSDQDAEYLRDDFDVSTRQLVRDIQYARRMGADIVALRGNGEDRNRYTYTCRNREHLAEDGRFLRYLAAETEIQAVSLLLQK